MTPFYDHTTEEVAAILTSGNTKLSWFENGQAPSQYLVTGLPAYDNTTVFVDRADEAYLEKLAEVQNHSCWTNLPSAF